MCNIESDEELVRKYCTTQEADIRENIFFQLFDRYNKKIVSRAYCYLNNITDSEEVAQNTWVGVVRTIDKSFDSQSGNFRNWLYGVLHNKIVDRYRKNKRAMVSVEWESLCYQDSHSPESEIKTILSVCISKFPRKYQTLLCILLVPKQSQKWRDIELTCELLTTLLDEISLCEIGEQFREPATELKKRLHLLLQQDLQENTVKVQRYRAIKMLQECFKKHGLADEVNN